MKIKKQLKKLTDNNYWEHDVSMMYGLNNAVICKTFVKFMLGKTPKNISIEFSSTNPKKKGYRKFEYIIGRSLVVKNNFRVTLLYFQERFLRDNLKDSNNFWVRITDL